MTENRQEELERLSHNRTIREQLTLVFPKNLTLFIVLGVLAILLLIWAFFGRIPTEITGRGVSMSASGTFLVTSNGAGRVTEIYVDEGDRVERGTPLALFYNPELKATLVHIEATEFTISQQEAELALLKSAYQTNLELYNEGLVAKLILDDSQTKVLEKQIQIEKSKAEIDTLFSKVKSLAPASNKIIEETREQLLDGKFTENLNDIERKLNEIRAPEQGRVLEVRVNEGSRVDRKEPLFWFERPLRYKEEEVFYSAVNANVIGELKPGMRVLIEPLIINPQEYGAIEGEVKEVYDYPVSEKELLQTIGNQQIVKFMLGETPVVTFLVIEAKLDPETPSGFKWTSREGPPQSIPTGTISNLKLIIDEQPPISYLIPLWRIKEVAP